MPHVCLDGGITAITALTHWCVDEVWLRAVKISTHDLSYQTALHIKKRKVKNNCVQLKNRQAVDLSKDAL